MPFLQKLRKNLKDMLKKCLDKRSHMTRSGVAAVNLPKCQYFDEMAFLHEKSANKVTETNLCQPSTFSTEALTEENQCFPLSNPCSSNSSNFDTSKKVQKTKKNAHRFDAAGCTRTITDDEMIDENDEDYLFCRSLIPVFREFPQREKRRAKIKIMKLIYELQYGIEE